MGNITLSLFFEVELFCWMMMVAFLFVMMKHHPEIFGFSVYGMVHMKDGE